MDSINLADIPLTDSDLDLQVWMAGGNSGFDNNMNLGTQQLPDNLNFTDTTSGQSFPSGSGSPFSGLQTPTSESSLGVGNNEQTVNNVSNKDKAIVDIGVNNKPSQNIVFDHTPALASMTPLSGLNTQLPAGGSHMPNPFGAQNTAQSGQPWAGNFGAMMPQRNDMMNNNNNQYMASSMMAQAPWLMHNAMQNTMHHPQPTMAQAPMMHANTPYRSHFGPNMTQAMPVDMFPGVSGNMPQQFFPGAANLPITDASGRLPKRRVPGQGATPRRVSPTSQRSASASASSLVKTMSGRTPVPFPTPSEWVATRTHDKPKDLSAHYQTLNKSIPVSQLAPIQRLSVHDSALRSAFEKGKIRAQEIMIERVCKDIGTQRLFGCNLQWPTHYNRTNIEGCVESYFRDMLKSNIDDDPATAAGMIRDSYLTAHPGLFPSSQECSAPTATQTRNEERRAQSTVEKAKEQPSPTKPKAKAQTKTQTTGKKGRATKSPAETDKFLLNGDGHFRILKDEKFEAALQRTVEKHEKEGTSFELSEPQDAPPPSATASKKRKANKPPSAERATKKPTKLVLPQVEPLVANYVAPTAATLPTVGPEPSTSQPIVGPKPSTSQLILPGMDNAIPEDTSTTATNVTEATNAVQEVANVTDSKAEYEKRRILELTHIDKGLPDAVILDFMYPKETSLYEVVRKAAKEGLQDQSELLKDPACRSQVYKILHDKHLAILNVEEDSRPEWDARIRNKEKRDRKKAAHVKELQAARAARDTVAPVEVVTREENISSAQMEEDNNSSAQMEEDNNSSTQMEEDNNFSTQMEEDNNSSTQMEEESSSSTQMEAMLETEFEVEWNALIEDGPVNPTEEGVDAAYEAELINLEELVRATYEDPAHIESYTAEE